MNTDALIARLAADLPAVRRLPPPSRRAALWLLGAVPMVLAGIMVDGFRADLAECLRDARFVTEFLAATATGLLAAWAAFASTVPGAAGWRLALPLAPAGLWLASLGAGCWREWLALGTDGMADRLWDPVCLPEVAATSLLPILMLAMMARRGAALVPARTAGLAALAAAALASAGLSLSHGEDAAITALVWHFGTVALLTGLVARFGHRLFRPARFP